MIESNLTKVKNRLREAGYPEKLADHLSIPADPEDLGTFLESLTSAIDDGRSTEPDPPPAGASDRQKLDYMYQRNKR